jgi:hypothetical protein
VLFHPNRKPPSTVFSVFLTDRQREPYSSSSRPSRLDHRRIDPSPSRSADRANRIIHSPEHLVQNESSLLCRYQEAGPGRFVGTTRRDSHFDHRSGSPIFDNRTNSSRDNRVSVNLVVSSHNRALRDARAPSPARFFADDHTRGDIHLFISAICHRSDSSRSLTAIIATHCVKMQAIQTHPVNAEQAKAFTARGSLSFPNAAQELSPPTSQLPEGASQVNGQQATNSAGAAVAPATPAATPGAVGNQGPSGITPTLQ